ncbi:hypothetical protein F0P96_16975 [Hymenobacter busanensis]|uniref:Uncharacterized protein n=1 Tax=Hymenobacter busanensis TaxID=2607656 RepID=A0AA88FI40_9BACT|nr:hypothetical protein F0P96_16975 [Hymenobacter busanensis]
MKKRRVEFGFPKPIGKAPHDRKNKTFFRFLKSGKRPRMGKKKPSEKRKAFKSIIDFGSVYETNSLPSSEQIIVPNLVIEAVGEKVHGCAVGRLHRNIMRNYGSENKMAKNIFNYGL